MIVAASGAGPLVSIVLPTLDGERFIATSIASCLAQTYRHLELLVIDGGSTDDTLRIVESFDDPRIRLVRQPGNDDRLPGALNLGFESARGELFTWTQDDDLYAPEAIATLVEGLERHPEAGMAYGGTVLVDETGQVVRAASPEPPARLLQTNPIGHSFLYRRSVADAVGPYDPSFFMAEDVHYWMRVHRLFPIVRLDGDLCFHRLHPGSLTCRGYGAYETLRVAARARRAVLGLGRVEYRRQLAGAYVEEAFAAYQRRDLGHVWPSLAQAGLRDPRRLARVGVASIAARSLVRA